MDMFLRTAFVAVCLVAPVFLFTPAVAQSPEAVCGSSLDPYILALDTPIAGQDNSAASAVTSDCFFSVAIPGGPEANVGKELLLSLTSSEDHNIFVKRGTAAPLAAPYTCLTSATTATSESCRVYWPLTQPSYSIRVARVGAGAGDFTITASLVAAPASGCPHGYTIQPLNLNDPQSITLGLAAGSRCYFSFQPNPGDDVAKAVATGLPASLGSYVIARGADVPLPATSVPGTATSGDYGCTLPSTGTTRTCAGASTGVPWYIVLIRATAVTTATPFGLTASSLIACSLGSGNIPVSLGVPISGSVDGSLAGQSCRFQLPLSQSESLSHWSVVSSGANVDLYLRNGVPVVTGVFDCGSAVTSVTGTDVCALPIAGVSDVFGSVFRPAAGATLGSFSLTVTAVEGCPALGPNVSELSDNVAVPGDLADVINAQCVFHHAPNPDASTVRVAVSPSAGSQTLLVRRGAAPTAAVNDCSAVSSPGSPAVCDLENFGDEIFATVKRVSGAGSFAVTALGLSPCSLGGSDVPLAAGLAQVASLTDDDGGTCRFKFDVPVGGGDAAAFELHPEGGNFDLYIRKDARPTASTFDCKSINLGLAADSCLIDAGTYFAMVQRVDGSGDFSIQAETISSCALGVAAVPLSKGIALSGSLLNEAGAKCYFAFTPGNPLANPLSPADDVVKLVLSQDPEDNFDLFVRRAAIPTTTVRDCQSILAAGSPDSCELIVPDGSTYHAMVRRVTGGGSFVITATTSSTCALGPGYHQLLNGQELQSSTRALAGSTKCYFALPSLGRDDLFSVVQEAKTANTGYTLSLAKDHAIGAGPNDCAAASSWISIPSLGLNLNTLAQCDLLLEDGLPHMWYISVSRTAAVGAANINFAVKGTAQQIPTLLPGVPQVGHVDTGGVQYWKVVLPENATFLDIQTAGDVSNLACSLGSQANSLVATACLLLPFPKLVGCALAAGYGVSCDQAELTLQQRCVAETGDAATCAQIEALRLEVCAAANDANPGSCEPADSSGSVSGTCGIINRQTGENTCDPLGASVKTTEMDLLVRYRDGLPKSSAFNCRSAGPGALERCLFSDDVQEIHDNVTEPARQDLNQQLLNLTAIIGGNRTAIDQAVADLKLAIAENRTNVIEPQWLVVRETVFALTGQDPGPLPATPAIPAVPGTPGLIVPDQTQALPLPGGGKYFIAVRGPLDLASSLYYQGGDYAIVALHDDLQAPTRDSLNEQLANILAGLDGGLASRCNSAAVLPAVCVLVRGLLLTVCEILGPGWETCAYADGLLEQSPFTICEGVLVGWETCAYIQQVAHDPLGLCDGLLGPGACDPPPLPDPEPPVGEPSFNPSQTLVDDWLRARVGLH